MSHTQKKPNNNAVRTSTPKVYAPSKYERYSTNKSKTLNKKTRLKKIPTRTDAQNLSINNSMYKYVSYYRKTGVKGREMEQVITLAYKDIK